MSKKNSVPSVHSVPSVPSVSASFENVLETSNNAENETRNLSKEMQKKNYEGKSKKGMEKCASIILDGKNVNVSINEEHKHESAKGFIMKGNTIRVMNAELFTKHVGKENVPAYCIPKGTRVFLRASSFELQDDVPLVKYTSLRSGDKEKGFDIKIDGKIFFMNPSLFSEGIKIRKR